jgi:hypothetical protein
MSRALPPAGARFLEIVRDLSEEESPSHVLAELNDFLSGLPAPDFPSAVEEVPLDGLSPFLRSYVAAMVEVAAGQKDRPPPAWTATVAGIEEPYFATPLPGLRLHLLKSAPVPFRSRNLFVDATVGARV